MSNIWGITTFFNSNQYKGYYENYKIFRKHTKKQGLNLIAVELAYNHSQFSLTKDDSEVLVQVKGKSVLWQKERLLNLALKSLPSECTKIVWIDADIIFDDNSWLEKTSEILDRYPIVQPFTSVIQLKSRAKDSCLSEKGDDKKETNKSLAYLMAVNQKELAGIPLEKIGSPGYVWAGRRGIFERHGFFDYDISGSGDLHMAEAFYAYPKTVIEGLVSSGLLEAFNKWKDVVYEEVKGQVAYLPGNIYHLWHGDLAFRLYRSRHIVIKKYNFDPKKDIRISEQGCWEWASKKVRLHFFLKLYFWARDEDKSLFLGKKQKIIVKNYQRAETAYHCRQGLRCLKFLIINFFMCPRVFLRRNHLYLLASLLNLDLKDFFVISR